MLPISKLVITFFPIAAAILVLVYVMGRKSKKELVEKPNESFSEFPIDAIQAPAAGAAPDSGALAPSELLPEGDAGTTAPGSNYLVASEPLTTIRNGNYDLRKAPEIESEPVGPWMQTTIGRDTSGIEVA